MGLRQKIKDKVPQDVSHALLVYVNQKGMVTAGLHGDPNSVAVGIYTLLENNELAAEVLTKAVEVYNTKLLTNENDEESKGNDEL